jgi:ubiquinone/menaquinone biosynthesis C-methylase UbiE
VFGTAAAGLDADGADDFDSTRLADAARQGSSDARGTMIRNAALWGSQRASAFPALYDCVMRTAERGRLAEWRRDVVRPADGDVLEIAAGTGLDFAHYRPGVTVVATEPDLRMLERARTRARRADATIVLVAADAEALPFRERAFDTVIVGLGLCTIPSPSGALAELRRVLRPGGVARLLEHVRTDRPIIGSLQDLLTPAWRRIAGGCRLNERTAETVRRAGFHIHDLSSYMGGCVVTIEASTPVGPASLECGRR